MSRFSVLIPARYASTRLPGKPLEDIAGKPMVVRVAERAKGCGAARVAVATDDERIRAAVAAHGIDAVPHPFPDHHPFAAADLALPGAALVVMTEKDAVKCVAIADARCWYLPVRAHVDAALLERVLESLRGSEAA